MDDVIVTFLFGFLFGIGFVGFIGFKLFISKKSEKGMESVLLDSGVNINMMPVKKTIEILAKSGFKR
jgi:hypothetical protein